MAPPATTSASQSSSKAPENGSSSSADAPQQPGSAPGSSQSRASSSVAPASAAPVSSAAAVDSSRLGSDDNSKRSLSAFQRSRPGQNASFSLHLNNPASLPPHSTAAQAPAAAKRPQESPPPPAKRFRPWDPLAVYRSPSYTSRNFNPLQQGFAGPPPLLSASQSSSITPTTTKSHSPSSLHLTQSSQPSSLTARGPAQFRAAGRGAYGSSWAGGPLYSPRTQAENTSRPDDSVSPSSRSSQPLPAASRPSNSPPGRSRNPSLTTSPVASSGPLPVGIASSSQPASTTPASVPSEGAAAVTTAPPKWQSKSAISTSEAYSQRGLPGTTAANTDRRDSDEKSERGSTERDREHGHTKDNERDKELERKRRNEAAGHQPPSIPTPRNLRTGLYESSPGGKRYMAPYDPQPPLQPPLPLHHSPAFPMPQQHQYAASSRNPPSSSPNNRNTLSVPRDQTTVAASPAPSAATEGDSEAKHQAESEKLTPNEQQEIGITPRPDESPPQTENASNSQNPTADTNNTGTGARGYRTGSFSAKGGPLFAAEEVERVRDNPRFLSVNNEAVYSRLASLGEKSKVKDEVVQTIIYDPFTSPHQLLDGKFARSHVGSVVKFVVDTSWLKGVRWCIEIPAHVTSDKKEVPLPKDNGNAANDNTKVESKSEEDSTSAVLDGDGKKDSKDGLAEEAISESQEGDVEMKDTRRSASVHTENDKETDKENGERESKRATPVVNLNAEAGNEEMDADDWTLWDLPPLAKGKLWGTDVYTDDSDILAMLIHTGWVHVKGLRSPQSKGTKDKGDVVQKYKQSGQDQNQKFCEVLEIDVRIAPRLVRYYATLRCGIKSRSWGNSHDGVSLLIEGVNSKQVPKRENAFGGAYVMRNMKARRDEEVRNAENLERVSIPSRNSMVISRNKTGEDTANQTRLPRYSGERVSFSPMSMDVCVPFDPDFIGSLISAMKNKKNEGMKGEAGQVSLSTHKITLVDGKNKRKYVLESGGNGKDHSVLRAEDGSEVLDVSESQWTANGWENEGRSVNMNKMSWSRT